MTENRENPEESSTAQIIFVCAIVIIVGGIAVYTGAKDEIDWNPPWESPSGYQTDTVFVEDGDYSDKREFERKMANGWKVIDSRRAWSGPDYSKRWGTEYTFGRDTYD